METIAYIPEKTGDKKNEITIFRYSFGPALFIYAEENTGSKYNTQQRWLAKMLFCFFLPHFYNA